MCPMERITQEHEPTERLLKATEVAELLNISRAFAYRLMKKGKIRTVFIEGARRVRPKDLHRYIEDNLYPEATRDTNE